MLRLLRGRTAEGQVSPAARLVAILIILGMLAVAAPAVFGAALWLIDLL